VEKDLLYRLALSCVPGIGPVYAKKLLNHFGDAEAIFKARPAALSKIGGIGETRIKAISGYDDFGVLEKELAFIEKYSIRCLFFTDKDYPQRLLCCKEAPVLLFYRGSADLNANRVVSIVGTRTPTTYGKQAVERLTRELAVCGPLIISGLAFGIDAGAHKAALSHSLPTVAVLGHGLNQIYPHEHKPLAAEIVKQGGLLTNFNTHSETSPRNFPLRNRIVAGMSDALVVVETDTDGGSMLTVRNALSYQKKIFAFPGRVSDRTSRGCNKLIQQGSAKLLLDGSQLMTELGWDSKIKRPAKQAVLFPSPPKDLPDNEKVVLSLLQTKAPYSLDELTAKMQVGNSAVAMALLNLELRGMIVSLPGKMYCPAM
jgi:DNA processing protein